MVKNAGTKNTEHPCVMVDEDGKKVSLMSGGLAPAMGAQSPFGVLRPSKTFTFDAVFKPDDGQDKVYQAIGKPIINDVMRGFRGCVIAYGQTGAGKTHSLLNAPGEHEDIQVAGLIPRLVTDLFVRIAADVRGLYEVNVAMCQIYNEQVDDLLRPKNQNLPLKREEDGSWTAEGLAWYRCTSPEFLMQCFRNGRKQLVYAETKMNKHSSRSHCVIQIQVIRRDRLYCEAAADKAKGDPLRQSITVRQTEGKLTIVDLAGSERLKKSQSEGLRLKEAQNINTSLFCFGNVVSALAKKDKYVPFRESTLTRLLEDSVGGCARTALLVCVAPEAGSSSESASSMEFALRAMRIDADPTVMGGEVQLDAAQLASELAAGFELAALKQHSNEILRLEEELRRAQALHEEEANERQKIKAHADEGAQRLWARVHELQAAEDTARAERDRERARAQGAEGELAQARAARQQAKERADAAEAAAARVRADAERTVAEARLQAKQREAAIRAELEAKVTQAERLAAEAAAQRDRVNVEQIAENERRMAEAVQAAERRALEAQARATADRDAAGQASALFSQQAAALEALERMLEEERARHRTELEQLRAAHAEELRRTRAAHKEELQGQLTRARDAATHAAHAADEELRRERASAQDALRAAEERAAREAAAAAHEMARAAAAAAEQLRAADARAARAEARAREAEVRAGETEDAAREDIQRAQAEARRGWAEAEERARAAEERASAAARRAVTEADASVQETEARADARVRDAEERAARDLDALRRAHAAEQQQQAVAHAAALEAAQRDASAAMERARAEHQAVVEAAAKSQETHAALLQAHASVAAAEKAREELEVQLLHNARAMAVVECRLEAGESERADLTQQHERLRAEHAALEEDRAALRARLDDASRRLEAEHAARAQEQTAYDAEIRELAGTIHATQEAMARMASELDAVSRRASAEVQAVEARGLQAARDALAACEAAESVADDLHAALARQTHEAAVAAAQARQLQSQLQEVVLQQQSDAAAARHQLRAREAERELAQRAAREASRELGAARNALLSAGAPVTKVGRNGKLYQRRVRWSPQTGRLEWADMAPFKPARGMRTGAPSESGLGTPGCGVVLEAASGLLRVQGEDRELQLKLDGEGGGVAREWALALVRALNPQTLHPSAAGA